jgi:RNA polymerase sigma factor (sigma-70 family)
LIESTAKFWEAIYSRNISKMIGICYRYTADRQLAEDLAHDAFLKAIDKAGSFKGDGVFEGWLQKVVVNHVLTYIRDQKRHQRIDDWLRSENNVVHPDDASITTDPSEEAEFSTQELLDVINHLPEHHRLVFNLYVIDDFKHAQIAELLGISEGTSKSHLARARKKIRQLLAEKVGRRRAIVFFLFPYNAWSIDRAYYKRFKSFEFARHKGLPDFSKAPSVSMTLSHAGWPWINIAAAFFVGSLLVASSVFYWLHGKNNIRPFKAHLTQSILKDSIDEKVSRENKFDVIAADERNNSNTTDSSAATIRRNSVIQHRNIKTNRMKTLDSLGIALLVSSGLTFDSAAQSTVNVNTSAAVKTHGVALENDPVEATNIVQFSAPTEVTKTEAQEGTFYATSLYWSAENHELYFKGKVKVDVGENNFVSSGSVTFLGKVYLLIINDSLVKLDSTIKLSEQQYRLTQLNNRQAARKYGEKGENGAVEINVIE